MKRSSVAAAAALALLAGADAAPAETIAAAELEIRGSGLRLVETAVITAIDVPTAIQTEFGGKQNDEAPFVAGLLAAAELTGPGLEAPITLTAEPGRRFHVPPLRAAGVHLLQNVRLVKDGTFVQHAIPPAATITVADVLQTSVRVRQLTAEELRARGINLDPRFYDVYEYTFSFFLDGELVEIPFPVVVDPVTREARPLAGESPYALPPDRAGPPPRWTPPQTTPFEFGGEEEMPLPSPDPLPGDPPPARPRIPAAIVIPNDIAVLHQFFSVALMVTNGAPEGSSITLESVSAAIRPPPELRVERTTPPVSFGTPVPIVDAASGVTLLVAQASGQGEWILEGLRPGTHTIEFDLRATYRAPGRPPIAMRASPRASIVVHDPRFNITFSHPDTVRSGSPYSTHSFITNLSPAAQSIRIATGIPSCDSNPSANVCRDSSTPEVHELTLAAGEMQAIEIRLVSSATGRVFATAGSIEGDVVSAAVELHMGVSESGIPLSPATLVLPHYAQFLDGGLLTAQLRLLGLGWSIATSPLNPTTARFPRVIRTDVFSRAVDLARAGQYVFLGASESEALGGLALDLLGNGVELAEWDELRRAERAGREAGAALARRIEATGSAATHASLLDALAAANAHRGAFLAAAVSGAPTGAERPFALSVRGLASSRRLDVPGEAAEGWVRQLPWGELSRLDLGGAAGELALVGRWSEDLEVSVTPEAAGPVRIDLVWPGASAGSVLRASLELVATAGAPLAIALSPGEGEIRAVDPLGAIAGVASASEVIAPPLAVAGARQDLHLDPTGRKVSLLFNRPIVPDPELRARFRGEIVFDRDGVQWNGPRPITSAALQTDARVVNLGFDHVLSANAAYAIAIDPVGDPLTGAPAAIAGPVVPRIDDDTPAGIVFGRVLRADGAPVAEAEVALSIYSSRSTPYPESTQVGDAREDGSFLFESVARAPELGYDGAYSLRAIDEEGNATSLSGSVRLPGRVQFVTLVYLGRGSAEGTVRYENGERVAGARVVAGSTMFSQFRDAESGADGFYRIGDLPVGPLTLSAVDSRGNVAYAAVELRTAGEVIAKDIVIQRRSAPGLATVRGVVRRSDTGGAVAGARVGAFSEGYAVGETFTDAGGRFELGSVPSGFVTLLAAEWSVSRTAAAIEFDLAPDAVREVALTLEVRPPDAMVVVEGSVVGEDPLHPGDPSRYRAAAGALVRIDGVGTRTADAAGRFVFETVPQTWSGRSIDAWDPATQRAASASLPTLQPGTNEIALFVPASGGSGTIRVKLLDARGFPVDGYRVIVPGFPPVALAGLGDGVYELEDVRVGVSREVWAVPPDSSFGDQLARGVASVAFGGHVASLALRLPGEGRVRVSLRSDIDVIGDVALAWNAWDEVDQGLRRKELTLSTSQNGVPGFATFERVPALQGFTATAVHPVHGRASGSGELAFDGDVQTITLELDRLAAVRGTVYEIDGRTPVAGASVRLFDGRQDQGVLLSGADGTFEFRNLPAATSFDAIASITRDAIFRTGFAAGRTPSDGGALEGVAVILRRRGVVEGRVVYADYRVFDPLDPSNNVPDDTPADPTDNAPVPLAKFRLRELGFPARSFGSEVAPLGADAAGRFELGNLFEGALRASAWDPQNQELRGDWSGELVVEGERVQAIVAIGAGGVGSIEASVLDPNERAAPVVDAEVLLLRRVGASWSSFDFAATDGAGKARFDQLPAGSYRVQAWAKALGRSGASGEVELVRDEIARETVLLEISGRVLGSVVDPELGGAGVAGSHVTLRAFAYETRTTSDPDGAFRFDGIREGSFDLTARDPQSNRFARASSALSSADPEPFVALELEPTETLHLSVALPADDGSDSGTLAPDLAVEVRQRCIRILGADQCDVQQSLQGSNPVVVTGMLRSGSYSVSIREIGGRQRTVGATRSFPEGDAAHPLRFVLPAFGSVRVTVSQGGMPAAGARVRVSSAGAAVEAIADASGVATLSGLLLGSLSIQATSLDGAFSGSGNVALTSQSIAAAAAIELGAWAGVAGFVEAEEGGASIGTRVAASFTGRTLEVATDADGRYRIQGIPTSASGTAVDLIYAGPDGSTIGARQSAVLGNDAASTVVELPPVRLDATPPRLLVFTPPDGAAEVSPDSVIRFTFSEPVRADQIDNAHFRLIPADSSASLATGFATSSNADGTFVVTMIPPPPPAGQQFPLRSNTLYRIVVSDALQDATGNRLGTARGASFITSDYAEPRVVRTEPPVNLPLQANASIRFVFNEPVDGSAFLPGGGATVSWQKIAAPGGAVVAEKGGNAFVDPASTDTVIFTPAEPIEKESFHRAILRGVRDLQGNAAAEHVFEFFSFDSTPPFVILVSPVPGGGALVSGVEYVLVPEVRNGDAAGPPAADLERVEYFRIDGAAETFVFQAKAAPWSYRFVAPEAPPEGAMLTIRAVARDLSLNASAPADLALEVRPNQPPSALSLALDPPAFHPSNRIEAVVSFEDEGIVATVEVELAGVRSDASEYRAVHTREVRRDGVADPWPATRLAFDLPADLEGGSQLAATLRVTDVRGLSATTTIVETVLADQSAPAVAILEPADSQLFQEGSGNTIPIRVSASDAETEVENVTAEIEGEGVASLIESGGEWTGSLPVPPVDSGEIAARTLTITATDLAGNAGSASVAIRIEPLFDPNAPVVSWACPTAGALFPPGLPATLRVHALGNDAGNPSNSVESVQLFVGGSTTPIAATAVAGMADHWEATITTPAEAVEGESVALRAVVTNLAGSTSAASTSFTTVEGALVTGDLTIDESNAATYEDQTLIVASGTITLVGPRSFARLVVLDGARITHPATTAAAIHRLELEAETLYVACGGAIDATGRGFAAAADGVGHTWPNSTAGGSPNATGGSHGGRGGSFASDVSGVTYGSIYAPDHPGAAGGYRNGGASPVPAGGGVASIAAGDLALDGLIVADAAPAEQGFEAMGAGGSVRIAADRLRGSGVVRAMGASRSCCEGAGGGGRIAIDAGAMELDPAKIFIAGGAHPELAKGGASGTIFVRTAGSAHGSLRIDNGARATDRTTDLPALGHGIAQDGSGGATLVTDRAAPIPPEFVGHRVEIRAPDGALRGAWRIAGIAGERTVDLAPDGSEIVEVRPGDSWRGAYHLDSLTLVRAIVRTEDALRVSGEVALDAFSAILGNNQGPPALDPSRIALVESELGAVVAGSAGAVTDPDLPLLALARNVRTGVTFTTAVAGDGSFAVGVEGAAGDAIAIRVRDGNLFPLESGEVEAGALSAPTLTVAAIAIPPSMAAGDASFRARRLGGDGRHLLVWTGDPLAGESHSDALVVFDVDNPAAPTHREAVRLGRRAIREVEVRGGLAFAASRDGLGIVDLDASPVESWSVAGGCGTDVAVVVDRSFAFVANDCLHRRIEVWDVLDPRAPRLIREQTTTVAGGHYRDLALLGERYLVGIVPESTDGADVTVIDRSNIDALTVVARFDVPGFAPLRARASGALLHLADQSGGWAVVDLSEPSAPVLRSLTRSGGLSRGIDAAGSTVALADGGPTVGFWLDLHPDPPRLGGSGLVGGTAWDVRFGTGVVYAANDEGIAVVGGIASPPRIDLSRIAVESAGTTARVVGSSGAIAGEAPLVATVANLASGVELSHAIVDGSFETMFDASPGDRFTVTAVDGSGRTAGPVDAGAMPFGTASAHFAIGPAVTGDANWRARRLAAADRHLVVTSRADASRSGISDRIVVLDVSDSAAPVVRQSIAAGQGRVHDAEVRGGWAYVISESGLRLLDLESTPVESISAGKPWCGNGRAVAVSGAVAFVTGTCGDGRIGIFDVGDPRNPVWIREQGMTPYHSINLDLVALGDEWLIGITPDQNGTVDLEIIDRRDLHALKLVRTFDVPGIAARRARKSGTLLYLTDEEGRWAVVDLDDPPNPVVRSVTQTPALSRGISGTGIEAVVANGDASVGFWNESDPSSPALDGEHEIGWRTWDTLHHGGALWVAADHGIAVVAGIASAPRFDEERIAVLLDAGVAAVSGTAGAISGSPPLSLAASAPSGGAAAAGVAGDGSFEIAVPALGGERLTLVVTDPPGRSDVLVVTVPEAPAGDLAMVGIPLEAVDGDTTFRARRISADATDLVVSSRPDELGEGSRAVVVLETDDPMAPVIRDAYFAQGVVADVLVRNRIVHILGSHALELMDLGSSLWTSYSDAASWCGEGRSLAADGSRAFVALDCSAGEIAVYEVSDPTIPLYSGTQPTRPGASYSLVRLVGRDHLAAWNRIAGELVVLDRRDPGAIVAVASMPLAGLEPVDGSARGSRLDLVGADGSIATIDLADPALPLLVSLAAGARPALGAGASGASLAIAHGPEGFALWDLSESSTQAGAIYTTSHPAGDAAFGLGVLYVAQDAGIGILGGLATPPSVDVTLIEVSSDGAGNAAVAGEPFAIGGRAPFTAELVNRGSGLRVAVPILADGSFAGTIPAATGDTIAIEVVDAHGVSSGLVDLGSAGT
ncbi:MAG TPA: Ig-like domain-containing protein [Thermoanaerobaculia bacterium]|nr:Ig-like domain-containing protein [Thermoanaerobaculia bacterium]